MRISVLDLINACVCVCVLLYSHIVCMAHLYGLRKLTFTVALSSEIPNIRHVPDMTWHEAKACHEFAFFFEACVNFRLQSTGMKVNCFDDFIPHIIWSILINTHEGQGACSWGRGARSTLQL